MKLKQSTDPSGQAPSQDWSLARWLDYLQRIHCKAIDMGLDRVHQVYQRMGSPKPAQKSIIVGGTNGKGSTIAFLRQILLDQDLKVGSYCSPHIRCYNERVQVGARYATDAELIDSFWQVERARAQTSLTYFEFATLAAFYLLSQQSLEVALLEVGLGGRLDAVNIIDGDISIITSIGLDHQEYLGDGREAIALEKLGIGRCDRPLISGELDLPQKAIELIQQQGFRWLQIGRDFGVDQFDQPKQAFFGLPSQTEVAIHFNQQIGLPLQNGLAAVQASAIILSSLSRHFLYAELVHSLNQVTLAGRFQQVEVPGIQQTIFDVAHNQEAMLLLAKNMARLNQKHQVPCTLVLGMLKDKPVDAVFQVFKNQVDHWYFVNLGVERALTASELTEKAKQHGIASYQCMANVADALQGIQQQAQQGTTLVTGSFYTVEQGLLWCEQQGYLPSSSPVLCTDQVGTRVRSGTGRSG